jgi:probable phosphoglycerate mutase
MNYPAIILLRHGETEWNIEGRFQGRLDSPLTQKGRLQAKKSGLKLKRDIEDFSKIKIFSSPLGRAKESAYIICDTLRVDRDIVIFDKRLIELNYGIFEGEIRDKLLDREDFKAREANKWHYTIKGGESYQTLYIRVKEFLDSIIDEKIVIIIAHEMVNRVIRGVYCNLSEDETLTLRQTNSTIIYLENGKEL